MPCSLAKGVMLRQRNIVCNLLQLDTVLPEDDFSWKGGPSDEGDVLVAVLPLYHIYGMFPLTGLRIPRLMKASSEK